MPGPENNQPPYDNADLGFLTVGELREQREISKNLHPFFGSIALSVTERAGYTETVWQQLWDLNMAGMLLQMGEKGPVVLPPGSNEVVEPWPPRPKRRTQEFFEKIGALAYSNPITRYIMRQY